MITLPVNAETLELAARLVWFESPEQALADPVRLLAYAFAHARSSEMATLRRYLVDEELREALERAPPGIIDARSWAYWRLMLDLKPAPLPQRTVGSSPWPRPTA